MRVFLVLSGIFRVLARVDYVGTGFSPEALFSPARLNLFS